MKSQFDSSKQPPPRAAFHTIATMIPLTPNLTRRGALPAWAAANKFYLKHYPEGTPRENTVLVD